MNIIQMTIISTISGQESLIRNGEALIVSKRVGKVVLGYNLKSNRIMSVTFSRGFYPKWLTVHSGYTFVLSVSVFPGNRTHNLCAANAMLYHWATGTVRETFGKTQGDSGRQGDFMGVANWYHTTATCSFLALKPLPEEPDSGSPLESS